MAHRENPREDQMLPWKGTGPDTSIYFKNTANKVYNIMIKIFNDLWDTKEVRCTVIFCFVMMLAVIFYCFTTRYQMIATAGNESNYVYMYDRVTGKTWRVVGSLPDYYVPVLSFPDEKVKKILLEEINKKQKR